MRNTLALSLLEKSSILTKRKNVIKVKKQCIKLRIIMKLSYPKKNSKRYKKKLTNKGLTLGCRVAQSECSEFSFALRECKGVQGCALY